MNEYVIRSYYRVTRCETIRAGYRQQLHQSFSSYFPNLNLKEQNVADRRAAIFRLNLVPGNIRARIYDEVLSEFQQPIEQQSEPENTVSITTSNSNIHNEASIPQDTYRNQDVHILQTQLKMTLEESLIKYEGIEVENRPSIAVRFAISP